MGKPLLGFAGTALAAARDHATPTPKGSMVGKTFWIADKAKIHGGSILPHPIQAFKISTGV